MSNLHVLCVLNDGETYSDLTGSSIEVYDYDGLSDDKQVMLDNGTLPDGPKITIDLATLLSAALEANLDCVRDFSRAIGY